MVNFQCELDYISWNDAKDTLQEEEQQVAIADWYAVNACALKGQKCSTSKI